MSVEDAYQCHRYGYAISLIDARDPEVYDTHHIVASHNVPAGSVKPEDISDMPDFLRVVIYSYKRLF